jgi:hypothetical protein
MSSAKQVVDSTIRRILKYTSEILISIILLVIISLPLAFAVPMWVQEIVFDVSPSNLVVNPIAWFGAFTTFGITLGLGIVSFVLGYLFLFKVILSTTTEKTPTSDMIEAEISEEEEEEWEDSETSHDESESE